MGNQKKEKKDKKKKQRGGKLPNTLKVNEFKKIYKINYKKSDLEKKKSKK